MKQAREGLGHWGIGGATVTRVAGGANDVFRVEPGPFALRVQPRSRLSDDEAASQLAWLDALSAESGVTVPEPVSLSDGRPFLVQGERRLVLLRWIEGESLVALPPVEAARLVGRTIARLHRHAEGWTSPTDFTCPGHEPRVPPRDILSLSSEQHALLHRAVDHIRSVRLAVGRTRSTFGVVHGDLNFRNFVLRDGEACPIDFDEFGLDYYLSDIAEPLRVITHFPDYPELRAALLEAYRSERPLSASEEGHLDVFIAGGLVSCLNWACRAESEPRRHEILPWVPDWLESIERLTA